MQMQQMRVGRAPQVPVPPVNGTPLEISREMRQQLRVTRHRAFERHQENAQWTQQLLDGVEVKDDALRTSVGPLQTQLEAKKRAAEALETHLMQQKETHETTMRNFEEMMTMLKAAGDAAALTECEEKVEAQKNKLLAANTRKVEIVRL